MEVSKALDLYRPVWKRVTPFGFRVVHLRLWKNLDWPVVAREANATASEVHGALRAVRTTFDEAFPWGEADRVWKWKREREGEAV